MAAGQRGHRGGRAKSWRAAAIPELARPDAAQDSAAVDALVAACFASEDYREGQAAFREKRDPVFRGR